MGTAASVKLTVASPVVQLTVQTCEPDGPLQATKASEAVRRMRSRALLRFMWHPTLDYSAFARPGKENALNDSLNVTRPNPG
jgi:hypothetical protein